MLIVLFKEDFFVYSKLVYTINFKVLAHSTSFFFVSNCIFIFIFSTLFAGYIKNNFAAKVLLHVCVWLSTSTWYHIMVIICNHVYDNEIPCFVVLCRGFIVIIEKAKNARNSEQSYQSLSKGFNKIQIVAWCWRHKCKTHNVPEQFNSKKYHYGNSNFLFMQGMKNTLDLTTTVIFIPW